MMKTSTDRSHPSKRIAPLAYSLAILFALAAWPILSSSAMTFPDPWISALKVPALRSAISVQSQPSTYYLHGTGPVANPPTLFLNTTAPTATDAKYKDSTSISRTGGNPWKEVGTWAAASSATTQTLASLSDFHAWLGLKNSDDQGTYFDLRVDAYKNGTLLTSGQSLCITGVTRNAANAKEVVVPFSPFSAVAFNGTSDVLNLKILTRVGTNADGSSCGGHNNAVGLRLYFDAVSRPSRFNATHEGSDTAPPALTVEQPADNSITAATQIGVTGTFSDQSPTTITVNGVAAALQGTNFTATVPLTEGQNSLLVTATDAGGNTSNATRNVIRDTIAPVVNLEQPENGFATNTSQVTVAGTLSDQTATTVSVNGINAQSNQNDFSAVVPLNNDGAFTLTLQATDAAGNQTVLTRAVSRDTVAPTLTIATPVNGVTGADGVIEVSGTTTDSSPVTVSANDFSLTVAGDGSFSGRVTVDEGETEILVAATDAAGNTTEATRTITIDHTPPVIDNIQPADGALVDSPAGISAHVTDASSLTVTINGVAATPSAGDVYTASVVLTEGENEITIKAVDAVAHETQEVFLLIGRDQTPPASVTLFPIVTPTRFAFQTVEGRAESEAEVTITGGTEPVIVTAAFGTGMFAANVNLAQGANLLTITSKDGEGNVSPPIQTSITSDTSLALPPAGQAARINISTGNAQKGLVNTELPRPLIAIVTDQLGHAVADVTVNFSIIAGGGQFNGGGSTLNATTDADGRATVRYISGAAPGPQQIRASFPSNSGTAAIFLAEALESQGSNTSVSGIVLDQNLRALPNVLVRLGGQETRTGTNGRFILGNVAAGPHQLLELIGRDQITLPGRWPNITYDYDVLPGIVNQLGRPLFLPKVNDGVALPLDTNNVVTQDTSFELPVVGGQPPIKVTARAGTHILFPPDVTDKRLSVTRIATNRVPMVLEDGRATNLYISVQPSGAIFDQPLEISFPNLDGLAANTEVLLMSFDHDAGRYIKVGTGHVSADGATVKADPGSGIRVGAWHALPPDPPQEEVTVLGHIQVEGNPAFESKIIESADAWVEGTRAVPVAAPVPIQMAKRIDFKATLSVAPNTAPRLSMMPGVAQTSTPTVTALVWQSINSTVNANPNTGAGERIYPDRLAPNSPLVQRTVRVRATVSPAQQGIRVNFKSFDLDDPSTNSTPVDTNGSAGNDNIGIPRPGRLSSLFAFTNASGVATVTFTVSMHPGDNYKVVASCTPGYLNGVVVNGLNMQDASGATLPTTDGRDTNMLTVWRRLHVEIDSMVVAPTTGAQKNSVTGTITSITSASISGATVPTRFNVSANLDDGSPRLDGTGANLGNGRFENGRIHIDNALTSAPIAGIEGNGMNYVENATTGFTIPVRVSALNQPDLNGTLQSLTGQTMILNIAGLTAAYNGGSVNVVGLPARTITAVNATAVSVTFGGGAIPFELFDDDSGVLPVLPDTSDMNDRYHPAYIDPVIDGGGTPANNKQTVAFKRNIDSTSSAALGTELLATNAMESDGRRANDFWIAYMLQAFQPRSIGTYGGTVRGDNDPISEISLGGVATGLNGRGAFAFYETNVDQQPENPALALFATVVTHEIAHEFGLQDCNTGCAANDMMGVGLYTGGIFVDADLRRLRERVKSPGRTP